MNSKFFFSALILISFFGKSQKYYPMLDDIFLPKEEVFGKNLSPLKSELKRLSSKMFFSDYFFSNNISGSSTFSKLSLIPLRNNNYNILGTGIDLIFNYHNPTKRTLIPITYQQNFSEEIIEEESFQKLESFLKIEDSATISLLLPVKYLQLIWKENIGSVENYCFDVFQIESVFKHAEKNAYAEITFYGRFSQPIFMVDFTPPSQTQKLILTINKGKKRLEISLPDEVEEKGKRKILFEGDF